MKINDIKIGLKHPPVIIAEMSGNHNNSIDTAMELVEIAAKSGVLKNLSDNEFVMGYPAIKKSKFMSFYRKLYGK